MLDDIIKRDVFILKSRNPYCCKLHTTLNGWNQKTRHHWEIFIIDKEHFIYPRASAKKSLFLERNSCPVISDWTSDLLAFFFWAWKLRKKKYFTLSFWLFLKKKLQDCYFWKNLSDFSSILNFFFFVTDIFQPQHSRAFQCPTGFQFYGGQQQQTFRAPSCIWIEAQLT